MTDANISGKCCCLLFKGVSALMLPPWSMKQIPCSLYILRNIYLASVNLLFKFLISWKYQWHAFSFLLCLYWQCKINTRLETQDFVSSHWLNHWLSVAVLCASDWSHNISLFYDRAFINFSKNKCRSVNQTPMFYFPCYYSYYC